MAAPMPLARLIAQIDAALGCPDHLAAIAAALQSLLANDDWLPAACATPHPDHYQQYCLYADPAGRFSIVSFVWGPGQQTPVHDHGVWGIVGVLRGAEISQAYVADGIAAPRPLRAPVRLEPGDIEVIGPDHGDVHRVANALADAVSISIHIYGTDIGRHPRSVYPDAGGIKPFISGYVNMQPFTA